MVDPARCVRDEGSGSQSCVTKFGKGKKNGWLHWAMHLLVKLNRERW